MWRPPAQLVSEATANRLGHEVAAIAPLSSRYPIISKSAANFSSSTAAGGDRTVSDTVLKRSPPLELFRSTPVCCKVLLACPQKDWVKFRWHSRYPQTYTFYFNGESDIDVRFQGAEISGRIREWGNTMASPHLCTTSHAGILLTGLYYENATHQLKMCQKRKKLLDRNA